MTTPETLVPEIAPADLVRALEAGEPLQVVDVRSAAAVATGRVEPVPAGRFVNVPGSVLRAKDVLAGTGIDPALPAAVVCGRGRDSLVVAEHLRGLGVDARSLRGGMAAYMDVVVPRELPPPPGAQRLVQFDRVGKGALGYLLASDGEALVVDPPRRFEAYLAAAVESGVRIAAVVDTHAHADYISGGPALARAAGAPYHLHPADSSYAYDGTPGTLAYTPLADGGTLRVGACTLRVWHTPGHTLGHACLTLEDTLAFTGDFVFVESLGRPDLGGRAAEWAPRLWDSLERAKREWAPTALVLPAHYAGEAERNPDRTVGARFGRLRSTNSGLVIADRDAFLAWAGTPANFPEVYRTIKAVNVGLHAPGEDEAVELEAGRNECAVARPAV